MKSREYFAFISYKRSGIDVRVANWIHTKLEKYPYPKDLVRPEDCPEHKSFIRRVFIDTKELHVSDEPFSKEIQDAIAMSRYLVVVCSKDSAKSVYVQQEIAHFLETHQNDYDKILPVFIDEVSGEALPAPLNNDILTRNCPIYKSYLNPKDDVNLYCFYHVVAFLLRVDFRLIYDRYRVYAQKRDKRKRLIKYTIYIIAAIIFGLMTYAVVASRVLIKRQSEIVKLEKEIFPYSVVIGYVDNFLKPVVSYFNENEPEACIYVHMPTKVKDLDESHKYRFKDVSAKIEQRLSLDSLSQVKLNTSMPRGSNVHKMYSSNNERLNHKYLDFASTTSTFLAIARKKKESAPYANVDLDDMIDEYTNIFIRQTNNALGADSTRVIFVKSIDEIISSIDSH